MHERQLENSTYVEVALLYKNLDLISEGRRRRQYAMTAVHGEIKEVRMANRLGNGVPKIKQNVGIPRK